MFHQLFYFKEISQWLIEFDCSSILSLMKLLLCSFGYFNFDYEKSFQFRRPEKSHLNLICIIQSSNESISINSIEFGMNVIIYSIISIQFDLKEFITFHQFEVKYLLNWFNSSIDIIFNHLEILQSDFNISFINWKEDWSFDSNYSFNINCFLNVMEISLSLWIKSSIGFQQSIEWKIHLFKRSIAETGFKSFSYSI